MKEMTKRLLSLFAICSLVSSQYDDVLPRTVSISPNFGRISGGTLAVVTGVNLNHSSSSIEVAFNDSNQIYRCQILQMISATKMRILVPKYNGDQSAEKTFTIRLIVDGTWSVNDTAQFTFKPEPIVLGVTPHSSILAGGTTLTLVGVHFDSVSRIVMDQSITLDGVHQQDHSSASYFHNSTYAKFRTPSVRYAQNNTVSAENNGALKSIQMLITISFEGTAAYNFSASVKIFANPNVLAWNPSQETFVANQNNEISIGAVWPAMEFSEDDIHVTVGSSACSDVRRVNGTLLCRPPPLSKDIIRFGSIEKITPSVVVSVGNIKYTVGSLLYTSEEPFHVIMIVTLAILAFIFLVAFVFGCIALCCPRRPAVGRKFKTNGVDGQAATLAYHPVGDDMGGGGSGGVGGGHRIKGRHESYDVIALEDQPNGEDANANEENGGAGEKDRFRKLDDDAGPSKVVV